MNIGNTGGAPGATSAVPGSAQILVMKKALDQQATNAAQLLQALPQMPQLASSGSLGRNVNTFA